MLTFVIFVLTVLLVLNCLLLILLVLIQLPKKEAGAAMAFGGGATDALFGAGSGNVLTRITKWLAGIFFALSLILSVLNTQASRRALTASDLRKALEQQPAGGSQMEPAAKLPSLTVSNSGKAIPTNFSSLTNLIAPSSATNAPAANAPATPATNTPAAPGK